METTGSVNGLGLGPRALRAAVSSAVATGVLFAVFVITGLAGLRGGWLWASALGAAVLGATAWGAWGQSRGRVAVAMVVALFGLSFGAWNAQHAPFSHGRLRSEMNSIPVPADFTRVADEQGGWSLCLDECSSVTRVWIVAGTLDETQDRVSRVFEDAGFSVGSWRANGIYGPTAVVAEGHRGRLAVFLMIDTKYSDGHHVNYLPVAPGSLAVSATLETA